MRNIRISIEPEERLGIAVSGGKDSMALLDIALGQLDSKSILVINIEHGIRGEQSCRDSEFVREFCKSKDIDCEVIEVDTPIYAKKYSRSIEQAARELRYQVFDSIIKEGRADKIALAHHKSDQCETIMMRILRGTGVTGLRGMQEIRDGVFIRPLLNVTSIEIEKYIEARNIKHIEDITNNDNDYSRNYVRNILFPVIAEKYPDYENSLLRLMDNAREDYEYIQSQAEHPVLLENTTKLPVEYLKNHASVVRASIIMCFKALGVITDIERKHIHKIIDMVNMNNGDSLDMPHGVRVYKEYDWIVFIKEKASNTADEVTFREGCIDFHNCFVEIKEYQGVGLRYDYDKIPCNAVIRYRQDGDKFTKFGGNTKSLGDYMTDIKIPKRLRNDMPLVAVNNQILIIPDYEISERIKVDNNTTREYTIKLGEKMHNDIESILIPKDKIESKVKELAQQITKDYKGKELLVLCILKGASVFFADLMRELDFEVTFEFIGLSSYRNTSKSIGAVKLNKDITSSVEDKDILVVEDIIDTGLTLTYLKELLKERGAKSVKVCTFLDKVIKRKVPLEGDYVGFEVPDEFVVGYGLDYAEKYRNLADVCILKKEVYE